MEDGARAIRLLAGATMEPCSEESLLAAVVREGLRKIQTSEWTDQELIRMHRGYLSAIALIAKDGVLWCAVRYPDGELLVGREEQPRNWR